MSIPFAINAMKKKVKQRQKDDVCCSACIGGLLWGKALHHGEIRGRNGQVNKQKDT